MSKTIENFRKAHERAYGTEPTEVHAQNTERTDFYKNMLWREFLGSVEVKVPDSWSIDFVRWALLWGGALGVTELDGAVVPYAYSIVTRNKWHYPITVQATGELAQDIPKRTIGEDTEIVYLESADFPNCPYTLGVQSLVDVYAQKLAVCDGAIDVNLFVTRTPWIFGVRTEKDVQDMKALVNRIMAGKPAVYYKLGRMLNPNEKDLPLLKTPAKENFVALDVQASKRSIIDEFLTTIGVNNANTDKRERLIQSEVDANNAEIRSGVALWQSNVDRTIKKVKKLYPDFFVDNEFSVKFVGAERGENELNRTYRDMEVEETEDDNQY